LKSLKKLTKKGQLKPSCPIENIPQVNKKLMLKVNKQFWLLQLNMKKQKNIFHKKYKSRVVEILKSSKKLTKKGQLKPSCPIENIPQVNKKN